MPWNKNDYPDAMKNLDNQVKGKAIEIANELVNQNYSEGRAIPIAIERAREWADNNGSSSSNSKIYHLVPDDDKWEIKKENGERASFTFDTKKEARDKANDMMKNNSLTIVIHKNDGTIEDTLTS